MTQINVEPHGGVVVGSTGLRWAQSAHSGEGGGARREGAHRLVGSQLCVEAS
jgi:hypothetical protein